MWGIVHLLNGDQHVGNIETRFDDSIIVEHPVARTPNGTPRTVLLRTRLVRLIVPTSAAIAAALSNPDEPPDAA